MKKKQISILFTLIIISSLYGYYSLLFTEVYDDTEKGNPLKLKTSGFWEISPFTIISVNDWETLAATEPWCTGNGTWDKPYIIENISINGMNSSSCLQISGTNEVFIIRNCTFHNSSDGVNEGGLILQFVSNGTLERNNCSFNKYGIWMQYCENMTLVQNTAFNNSDHCIAFSISSYINVSLNNASYSGLSGLSVSNVNHSYFYGNNMHYNTNPGMEMGNGYNNTFLKNNLSYNYGEGIKIANSDIIRVINNTLDFNTNVGLSIVQNNNITVQYNQICNNKNMGIKIEGCVDNVKIYNNTIIGNEDNGIYATNSLDVNITQNRIIGNTYKGIEFVYMNNSYIIDNEINNNLQEGIKFRWGGNNVVIGNRIKNDITTSTGLHGEQTEGIQILNNTCTYCDVGLSFTTCEDITIFNNTIKYSAGNGIGTGGDFARFYNISDNTIENNGENGIDTGMNNSFIINNIINDNTGEGIKLGSCNALIIFGNQLNGNNRGVYTANVFNISIIDNIVNTNDDGGIWFYQSENIIVYNNTIGYNVNFGGIVTETSARFINITDNTIENNEECGIKTDNMNNSFIIDNNINDNGDHGIHLSNSHFNLIANNTCNHNADYIKFDGCSFNNITGNTITNSLGYGVGFVNCEHINIFNNTIDNSSSYAIWIVNSSYFEIAYNTMINNSMAFSIDSDCSNINIHDNTIQNRESGGFPGGLSLLHYILIGAGIIIVAIVGLVIVKVKKKAPALYDIVPSDLKKLSDAQIKERLASNRQKAEELRAQVLQEKEVGNFQKILDLGKQALGFLDITAKVAKKLDIPILSEMNLNINTVKSEMKDLKSVMKMAQSSMKSEQKKAKLEKQELKKERDAQEAFRRTEKELKEKEAQELEYKDKKQVLEESLGQIEVLLDQKKFLEVKRKSANIMTESKALKLSKQFSEAKKLSELADALELTERMKRLLDLEYELQEELTILVIVRELKYSIDESDKLLSLLTSSVSIRKSEKEILKREAEVVIQKLVKPNLYDMIYTMEYTFEKAKKLGVYMLEEGIINVFPNVPEKKAGKVSLITETGEELKVIRGGDWKIEGNQSVFYFKVKVENTSPLVITNIQILLTSIPRGLEKTNDRYQISSLRPNSYESPSFKLLAKESCVGDIIEGFVSYVDPTGNAQTLTIEPFEIRYVCNLLVPKRVSDEEYDYNIKNMEKDEIVLDCNMKPDEIEEELSKILANNNFFLLDKTPEPTEASTRTLKGYAEGKYDQKDVALSASMEKIDDNTTKLVIQAMSERQEKVIDLLRDISLKCDDIKSDTELIKEYTSQIEEIFDQTADLESFLKSRLASDWQKIKFAWEDYKSGKIDRKELIIEGLKVIGKKFIAKIISKANP